MKTLLGIFLAAFSTMAFSAEERIISLGGNVTEIVYELNKEDLLVATDTTSNYPAAAAKTPKVGYMRQLSAEGILSMEPTVIFMTTEAGPPVVIKQLKETGVNMQIVPSEFSIEGTIEKVATMSKYLGEEEKGQKIIKKIKSDMAEANAIISKNQDKKPKVLFILSPRNGSLMVSGVDTQADSMIKLAGGENAMTSFEGFKPLTPEQILAVNPEVILMMNHTRRVNGGKKGIMEHPVLKLTPAVKNNKVITMDGSYLLGFGPRVGQAVKDLAEHLYVN